jgi:hypothetical protein
MKLNSVQLMRDIRDRMSHEIQGMSWSQEQEYLRKRRGSFDALLKEMPNEPKQPTLEKLRVSGSGGWPG